MFSEHGATALIIIVHNITISRLPCSGLVHGIQDRAIACSVDSSVVGSSIVHILDDVDLSISGPIRQASCPEC